MPDAVFLFVLGAVASLVGDHSHAVTGTLYPPDSAPFIWSSPIWFPVIVGGATIALAEIRLHLSAPRASITPRQGLAGVAAAVGIYVVTALVHTAPPVPATALVYALAVIAWCALGDRAGAICGGVAAIVGTVFEAVLVNTGVFAYNDDSDALFGVPLWLPALYFAFGVVGAVLGEIAARERQPVSSTAA